MTIQLLLLLVLRDAESLTSSSTLQLLLQLSTSEKLLSLFLQSLAQCHLAFVAGE